MGTIYRDNLSPAGIYDGDLTFTQHYESWVTLILATGSLYNWIAHFLTAAVNILKPIATPCPACFAGLRIDQKAFLGLQWSTSSSFLTNGYAKHRRVIVVRGKIVTRSLYVSNRNFVAVFSVAYRIYEIVSRCLTDDI